MFTELVYGARLWAQCYVSQRSLVPKNPHTKTIRHGFKLGLTEICREVNVSTTKSNDSEFTKSRDWAIARSV